MEKLKTKVNYESIDLKLEAEGDMTFSGYLAVFNNVDSYGDIIKPGAFKACLRRQRKNGRTPPMLEQHGYGKEGQTPIGVWTKMEEDDFGLYVEGKLFSTTRGKDFYTILKESPSSAVGMSIGYIIVKGTQNVINGKDTGGRILTELDLKEGSIVTFPANDSARVSNVKDEDGADMEENILTVRDLEKLLKDEYELSSKKSKELISKLKSVDIFTFREECAESIDREDTLIPEEVKEAAPEEKKDEASELRESMSDVFDSLAKEEAELRTKNQIRELVNELSSILSK